jgi:ATP-dependent exoDNAse (exonuclease V) beta subunit
VSGRIDIMAKNLMILASAGAGKTYQLGNRVIGLVGARGVDPERIVALTFTRKAAGEFADSVLTKLALASEDEARARMLGDDLGMEIPVAETLGRVVGALPRFQLGTLDGFFSRVVRGFQYELGLSGGVFELVEGPKLELALADILSDILGGALGRDGGEEFLHAFKRATLGREGQGVERLLQEFFKDWHGLTKTGGGPGALGRAGVFDEVPEISEWESRKNRLSRDLERAIEGIEWTDKRQQGAMQKLIDSLAAHTVGSGSLSTSSGLFGKVVDWLAEGDGPLAIKHYKEFVPGPQAEDLLRETLGLLAGCELAAAVERTRAVAELVACFDRECERRLRRRGMLGFDDVKVLMGEWSRSEEARLRRELVDFRLDGRYDHWLLDEFQDTSPAEWTGILPLLDEAATGEDGTLFVVGDDKQAIYGWRGGDVRLFERVRERYHRGGGLKVEKMPESRRSCPAVIDLVNRVCGDREVIGRLLGEELEERWPWEEHSSALLDEPGEARVELLEREGRGGEERMNRLVGLLEELQIGKRELSCGVLVRTNDQLRAVAERLRAEGHDVIEEGSRRPVEDNPIGVALFHLVAWLANPDDLQAREVVWMSPLGQRIDELHEGPWQAAWEGLTAGVAEGGFATTLGHLIEPLWPGMSEFGRRRAGDVIGALAGFETGGGGGARAALRWIEGLEVAQSPGVAAIQVMTVHKAKGLGFDVVILPEIEDSQVPNAGHFKVARDEQGSWMLQPPAAWVRRLVPELRDAEARWAADQRYEALCVLYVALTRARRGLYVLLTEPPSSRRDAGTYASPANLLLQTLDADQSGVVFQSGDPGWIKQVERRSEASPQAEPVLAEAIQIRGRSTPSGAKQAAQPVAGGWGGMRLGREVHAEFERIGWLGEGVPEPGEGGAAELVRECLEVAEIAALFERRDGIEALREQPIEVLLDGHWMSGVIDRLLISRDEQGKALAATVVDFKTDRIEDAAELAERYSGQMLAYRRAVAEALEVDLGVIDCAVVSTALKQVVKICGE